MNKQIIKEEIIYEDESIEIVLIYKDTVIYNITPIYLHTIDVYIKEDLIWIDKKLVNFLSIHFKNYNMFDVVEQTTGYSLIDNIYDIMLFSIVSTLRKIEQLMNVRSINIYLSGDSILSKIRKYCSIDNTRQLWMELDYFLYKYSVSILSNEIGDSIHVNINEENFRKSICNARKVIIYENDDIQLIKRYKSENYLSIFT